MPHQLHLNPVLAEYLNRLLRGECQGCAANALMTNYGDVLRSMLFPPPETQVDIAAVRRDLTRVGQCLIVMAQALTPEEFDALRTGNLKPDARVM